MSIVSFISVALDTIKHLDSVIFILSLILSLRSGLNI